VTESQKREDSEGDALLDTFALGETRGDFADADWM
jgi:hypothetical protein